MNYCLWILVLGVLVSSRAFATNMQPQDANIAAEHENILRFLEDLGSSPGDTSVSLNTGPHGNLPSVDGWEAIVPSQTDRPTKCLSDGSLNFSAAPQSPFSIDATMQMMTAIAGTASRCIGTVSQPTMAQTLQSYGVSLASSPNPTLSTQGGLMQEEAAAVNLGDESSAQSFVAAMQSLPPESTGEASPSPEDQAWEAELRLAGQEVAQSAASGLSQAALQALAGWLQSDVAGSSGTANETAALLEPMLESLAQRSGGSTVVQPYVAGQGGGQNAPQGGQPLTGLANRSLGGGSVQNPLIAPSGGSDEPLKPGSGTSPGGALPDSNL